jgi:hypothetical protein
VGGKSSVRDRLPNQQGKQLDGEDVDEDITIHLKETFPIGTDNLNYVVMPLCCWIGTPLNPTFRQALEDYYSQMEDLA